MGVLGKNVLFGFGDVLIDASGVNAIKTQGKDNNLCRISFAQLMIPGIPEIENVDTSVQSINLFLDVNALQILHVFTGKALKFHKMREAGNKPQTAEDATETVN